MCIRDRGYTKLLEESAHLLNELKSVVNENGLSMSDKDRMDIIAGNYSLLSAQQQLKGTFNLPLLVCISRKRMVWRLLDSSADEALNGTTAVSYTHLTDEKTIRYVQKSS